MFNSIKKYNLFLLIFIFSIGTLWAKDNPLLNTINPEYKYLNHPKKTDFINRLTVYKKDSFIYFGNDIKIAHRIFGFKKPSFDSQIIFLLSLWTPDVKNNPFHAKLGAYYYLPGELKYLGTKGDFIKTSLNIKGKDHIIYFDKAWCEFK